ncbi:hypothetical protein GE21DRAFT_1307834 [Neurospora crassa]|nr:hypothetical protein GE21DRAFT_1307834 [Neurospora crassa]
MGHFSAQKTHDTTSRSLWVLSPCVLTRGIILMNMNSSSSSAIRLLAQRSMERDLSQETRELIDLKALVAVTKYVAACRHQVEEIEASLLSHMMRHEMRMTLGISPLHQPRPIYKATDPLRELARIALAPTCPARAEPIDSFRTADLHSAILRNVKLAGYDMPTPIRRYYIPATVLWQESVRGLS